MTLRRPAAHLRKAPACRRSGDESYWERLLSEDVLTPVARPPRAPRPQSAIEGGQLDSWLEQLQGMQGNLLTATAHDQVPVFNNRTASMPTLNKEPTGRAWRQLGIPSFSGDSSSCGSSSLCGSLLGSQESLQTGLFPPPECRGSCERVHIVPLPRKEQPQVSFLAPVKTGWLPIQRRVMMMGDACNQNQPLDQSVGQLKLKQPITPTFQKIQATPKAQDGEVERSHTSPRASSAKMWETPDQFFPIIKQVPEKQRFPANEENRPISWQVLRRGWNTNRVSALSGGSQSIELHTETSLDPNTKPPLMKTTSSERLKHTPLQQAGSAEPCKPHTPLQGANSTQTHTPFHRASSVLPVKATTPLCQTKHGSQPLHLQTTSSMTTLIPQNKAGFSSITISSRKVSRTDSLPDSSSQFRESPSPPLVNQPINKDTRQVTVQRKATIVKVTEQRVMSNPVVGTKSERTPFATHSLDTVVHRRKATIIKVTEHRESYSSPKTESRTRHPEYRHSYTEGVYNNNNAWSQGNHEQLLTAPSYHHLDLTKRSNPAAAPNTSTSNPEKNDGSLHRSTLSLFVSNPPARAALASSEVSPNAVGQRSERPHRPLSWYGNVFGHTEPSKENVTQAAARKRSLGLPQETSINPVNSNSSFISPGTAGKKVGQLEADNLEPNTADAEDPEWRASPCLTLIKAPDPHSRQTPEEVLAINAAAIIANIKLQRQLSKKSQNGNSEKNFTASCLKKCGTGEEKPHPDQSPVKHHNRPPAAFTVLSLDSDKSPETISLQEALQKSRPDFISRSLGRVRELERWAQERRETPDVIGRQRKAHSAWSTSPNDNLLKSRDRAITGKEMQLRSKCLLAEMKKKKDEEKKKEVCLSNRQRVVLFKKKLLDQILQRTSN